MADLFDNPMGLCGFEFVEFASPTPNVLEPLFEKLGFRLVAKHRSKDVVLYRQGDINFIINREPRSLAGYFAAEHGPGPCAMAFRVRDAHKAYARALEQGAQPIDVPTGPMELRLPAIKGIGGAPLYLIDRFEDGKSIYDIDFEFIEGVDRHPVGHGFKIIDHLTIAVLIFSCLKISSGSDNTLSLKLTAMSVAIIQARAIIPDKIVSTPIVR